MAKKEEASKVVLERIYVVPLRRYFQRTKYYKRTNRAVSGLKDFLCQHMKVEKHEKDSKIKIGKYLNLELWKHGIQNPPPRVKIKATKDDKGIVTAELTVTPEKKGKKEAKKEKKAVKKEKTAKETAEKKEAKQETPAENAE